MTKGEPTVEWKLHIPLLLAARVEHMLMNPMTRKPHYGLRSKIIVNLLTDWANAQQRHGFATLTEDQVNDILEISTQLDHVL